MRLLLDTHVLLWALTDDSRLLGAPRTVLTDARNQVFASSINLWEIAIKAELGKLEADVHEIRSAIDDMGLLSIPFDVDDAGEVARLPLRHRDPFDRALVAQARNHGLRLLTADKRVAEYGEVVLSFASLSKE